MRSFEIYGKWSVQASKQASIHTHTCTQCSHASVGLAQARPKKRGENKVGVANYSVKAGRAWMNVINLSIQLNKVKLGEVLDLAASERQVPLSTFKVLNTVFYLY